MEKTTMWARRSRWWWRVLVGLPFVASVCLAQPIVQEDLLKSLVEKNEAAWQKIQSLASLQYTLERERLYPPWPQPFRAVAHVKKRGDCLWSVYRFEIALGPSRVVPGKDMGMGMHWEPDVSASWKAAMDERRVVVNPRYLAEWCGPGDGSAYCQDHNSVAEMDPWWRPVLHSMLPPDFQYVCFGLERQRFPEILRAVSTESRYEAAEVSGEDGRRLYEIRRFDPSDDPSPDMVWTIDPQKGFLATQYIFQAAGETPVSRQTIRVEQIAPEVWCPVACEETQAQGGNRLGDPPRGEIRIKTTLKEIRVNEPIPDEQFEIDALGLAQEGSGVIVTRITVDRRMTYWVYREGKLVPRE
jgi:hypothetical protein